MANIFYKSSAYIAPFWTSSATVTLTLTSSSEGGAAVTEAHISSSPNFGTYTTVIITTSPQTAVFTVSNPTVDGKKFIYVRYKNANGGLSATSEVIVYLDTTIPTRPGQPYSLSAWSTNDFENNPQIMWSWTASYDANGITSYTVQIEEDTGSGYVLKKTDGVNESIGISSSSGSNIFTFYTFKDLQDGADYRIRVKAIDLVGRESSWSQYGSVVTADTVAPHSASIAIVNFSHTSITETSDRNVELKVSATEDIDESGIYRVRFRNKPLKISHDGSTIEYQVSSWSVWYSFTSSPSYYKWSLPDSLCSDIKVEAQIQDVAQNSVNVEDTITVLRGFIIDTVAPTGSMEINDGAASTNNTTVKLDISGSDVTTNIFAMRFRDSDRSWSDWEPFDPVRYYTMKSSEGLKVVETQLKDYGGNIVADYEQLFSKDFVNAVTGIESSYLSYERIIKFIINNNLLYAFSKGSVAQGIYAKMYQFLNNQFIEIYEFDTEQEHEISAVGSFGNNIYIGTSKTLAAKVYFYNVNNATMAVSSNFSNLENRINALETYNNKLYAGSGSSYVYVFDGSAWSSRGDTKTIDTAQDQVSDLQVYNNYLHIATGNSGNMYTYDGTLSAAMTTGAQAINNLTIINDLLVGISQSTNAIYIYRETLDSTIWNERLLFNREPSDFKNPIVWNKFSSGSPEIIISQGIMEIYCPQGSTLLYLENEVGQTWVDGVSNTIGWTLQMTVVYDTKDVNITGPQGVRFSDGIYAAELQFTASTISLLYGSQNASYAIDMSTPHEIRIVGQTTNLKVFVDRIEIISITNWSSTSSSKVLQFGDVALHSASKAKWDAFRISTGGAYEPTDIASQSDITVIPWYANSVISDIVIMDVMRNATDIEDIITTVLVNDASISDISSEIDDARSNITTLNNFIGGAAYDAIFADAVTDDRLNNADVTSFKTQFNTSESSFANISSLLLTIKNTIASMDEINIQSTLIQLDNIVVNVEYYAIKTESIITVDIPALPTPRDAESIGEISDEVDAINVLLAVYIVSLTNIVTNLAQSGDNVFISGRNLVGEAQVWSTYDFSTYSSVVVLTSNINVTHAMELFPTDDVGGETENRMFIAGYDSNANKGYVKLIRDSYIADDILLDTTPPTGTIIISPDGSGDGATQTNSNIVILRLTGIDSLSGIEEYALVANGDFSGSTYEHWIVSPTWINNYNLTSTETAFEEIEDFTSNIISLVNFDNMLYIGTYSGDIYRSSDLETFTLVFDGSSPINCLAVYESKIYAGLQNGVFLESSNGALNQWVTKSTGLINSSGGVDVVPIYCMQVINSVLYVGGGNSLLNYFEFDTLNYVYNFSEVAVLSLSSFTKNSSTYILVGTGSAGKIFILDPTTNTWSVSYNSDETEISAMSAINLDDLTAAPQYVLAGSSPKGKIYLYTISSDSWELYHDTAETKIWSMANMTLGSGATTYPAVVIGTGNNGRSFVFRDMDGSPRIIALGGNLDANVVYALALYGDNMYFGTGDQGKLFKYDGTLVGNGVRSVYLSLKDRAGNVNVTDIYDEIDLELLYENMLIEVDAGGEAQFTYTAGDSKLYSGYKIENEYGIYESIDFTGGSDFNQWNSLSWTEVLPSDTDVEVYIKTATTKTGLTTANYNGPYTDYTSNDISELIGEWIKFKIVLKTSAANVAPTVSSLVISYYAAESAHFFTTLFNLSSNIIGGIATWTATIPAYADIKVGIATEDTIDWLHYQILDNNVSFVVNEPDKQFKIGIRFIASGDQPPSLDELAIVLETEDQSINLLNQ